MNANPQTTRPTWLSLCRWAALFALVSSLGAIAHADSLVITAQPQSQTSVVGGTVGFDVAVDDAEPDSFQWLCNGAIVAGATNSSLTLSNVSCDLSGAYTVIVSNSYTSVTSAVANLTASRILRWGVAGVTNILPNVTNAVALTPDFVLKADGTVACYGGYSQTNVPPGLSNVVALSEGRLQTLALKRDGTVFAWGQGHSGETNIPVDLTNAAAVSGGVNYSLILKRDGTLVQCGTNSLTPNGVPQNLTNVVQVAAGFSHSVALRADGGVTAWGRNGSHQTNVPSGLTNVMAIAAGDYHTLALRDDGTVVGWGDNSYNAVQIPFGLTNVVAIAAGATHSLALKSDGSVVSWGCYSYSLSHPVTVPSGLSGAAAIAADSEDSLALGSEGAPFISTALVDRSVVAGSTVPFYTSVTGARPLNYQWRLNGQNLPDATNAWLIITNVLASQSGRYSLRVGNALGTATTADCNLTVVPLAISSVPQSQTVNLGSRASFSAAAAGAGPLSYQWLLNGTVIPGATNSSLVLSNTQFSQHGSYSVAINDTYGNSLTSSVGTLTFCPVVEWGDSRYKQTNVSLSLTDVVAIARGDFYSLALKQNGQVVAWGDNSYNKTNVPANATNVVAIAGGGSHSLALNADSTVVAWGADPYLRSINPPVGLTNVVAVASGADHFLALKRDGSIVPWGVGAVGYSGPYGFRQAIVPTGLTNVIAIAAGDYHSLALKSDGTVAAWGCNDVGQTNVPGGLTGVVAIAGGGDFSLALKSDGTVVGWGENNYFTVPADLTNVVAIAAGERFALALKVDGSVVQWGNNPYSSSCPAFTQATAIGASLFGAMALISDAAPSIGVQLPDQTVISGSTVNLSLPATGAWPLSYQWQFNGTNLPGATNRCLTLTNVQTNQSGVYSLQVGNSVGSATNAAMALTIVPALKFEMSKCAISATDGHLHLCISGPSGKKVILEKSSDLTNWTPVATNSLTDAGIQVAAPVSSGQQFYRLNAPLN